MTRRLLLFGFGALISIFFLSSTSENRLKDTFYAYVDYFNADKRVVKQLSIADSLVFLTKIDEPYLRSFYDGAWVNRNLTRKETYPQIFILENIVDDENIKVNINFYDREERVDSLGNIKRYTKSEIVLLEKGVHISSRSYRSYFALIIMFFAIMIPVIMLVKKLILKK
jgi:hypothetical protein